MLCNFRQSSWTTIEPVWKELAESFEGSDEMIIASVDCKKYKDLCKTHKVSIINPRPILDSVSDKTMCPSTGPSCSKLMTSLVNDSLKFTSSDTQIC